MTPTPRNGGSTFAERPEAEAPEARTIWHAELDSGTLAVVATPTIGNDHDEVDPTTLAPWLTVAAGPNGIEHVVVSDGWHHLRIDLAAGSLRGDRPVVLAYRLRGIASAVTKLLPLRRLLHRSSNAASRRHCFRRIAGSRAESCCCGSTTPGRPAFVTAISPPHCSAWSGSPTNGRAARIPCARGRAG